MMPRAYGLVGGSILLACPMKKEAEVLRELLPDSVEVLATGVGVRRSVPALLRVFRQDRPSLLIFTGSASQLDLDRHRGDVVMPRRWCFENGSCTACDPALLQMLEEEGFETVGSGLSLDRPVLKAEQRRRLFESTGSVVFDSVTAAAVRAAHGAKVRCLAPKIVGHTVGSGLSSFWNRLDRNMAPLGDYLNRLLVLVSGDETASQPGAGNQGESS